MRRIILMMASVLTAVSLTGCIGGITVCKASGCNESIDSDGYCTFHYYAKVGTKVVNDMYDIFK